MPVTIGANGLSITDTANTVGGGTDTYYAWSASSSGHRNLIINGAMRIDQRFGGTASSTGSGRWIVDRFAYLTNYGNATCQQVSDSQPPGGFYNSAKVTVNSSGTQVSNSYSVITYYVEGYDASRLGLGTIMSQSIGLGFWVRSSVTGTYCVAIRNASETRSYIREYSITAANTWQYVYFVFSADSAGTWNRTNGIGLSITWTLGSGSTYRNPSGQDIWSGANYIATPNQVNFMATVGATFYITGVSLEDPPTGGGPNGFGMYEHVPYGYDLRRCQRYCSKLSSTEVYPINGDAYTDGGKFGAYIASAYQTSAQRTYTWTQNFRYPVEMRATPTVTFVNTNLSGSGGAAISISAYDPALGWINLATGGNGAGIVHVNSKYLSFYYEYVNTSSGDGTARGSLGYFTYFASAELI